MEFAKHCDVKCLNCGTVNPTVSRPDNAGEDTLLGATCHQPLKRPTDSEVERSKGAQLTAQRSKEGTLRCSKQRDQ